MFIALLIRRFGLAIGGYFFVYYLAGAISELMPRSLAPGTQVGLAIGSAILAFFLPRPAFKKEHPPS